MAAETDKTMFQIGEDEYELPVLSDLDIDEWMIVYEYSKIGIGDLQGLDDPEADAARLEKLNNPGLWKALAHIGYKRAHPKKTNSAIKDMIGTMKLMPMLDSIVMPEVPENPTPATEPEKSSSTSSDSSNGSSSPASSPSSETQEDQPAATGISG